MSCTMRCLLLAILTGVLAALSTSCGQHYSEKQADEALAERGLIPLRETADPHANISSRGSASAALPDGQVQIGDLTASIPGDWLEEPPSSSMRVAQFAVQGESGAAELAVFSGNWGSIDDNVDRWVGQFTQPDGGSTLALTQRWEIRSDGGIDITMVDIPGTFSGGMGSGEVAADYRMLGAIVPAKGTFYYLKFTGPAALIERQREAFDALVRSLKSS